MKNYPTEFVARTCLAKYPHHDFKKRVPKSKILDVGFGDGRNTASLGGGGLSVSGIEKTQRIVEQIQARLKSLGYSTDLRVGRNSSISFTDEEFDYILGCHCCYYCDEGETLLDNLKEYSCIMKKDAFPVASLANGASYTLDGAKELPDGSLLVQNDPYNNRNGYRLPGYSEALDIEQYFTPIDNDYFGISERVFWVVCQKD